MAMILYFFLSIINSLAQNYVQEEEEQEKKDKADKKKKK